MTRWGAPHLDAVQPYVPGKPVELLARELGIRDAVKLASNECPRAPSAAVQAAVRDASGELHRYPDDSQYRLRQTLAERHGVDPASLVFGHGSSQVIDMLCRGLCTPTDHAVIGVPSFVAYDLFLKTANVPVTRVPLREHLFWDLDALRAAVRPETRLLFLDNPNNPTSTHVGAADLEAFLKAVPEHVVVVVDEAYFEFADAPDYRSALTMRHTRERLVVLRTLSKAFGLAGLRIGYGIAPPQLADYLQRVRLPFNVNLLALAAAQVALEEHDVVAHYVALNQGERTRMHERLTALGLRVAPSQANFVTLQVGRPGREVYDGLLRRGVIVRDLGPPLGDWLRVSLGEPAENDRFVEALRAVLNGP